jgi:hypothetical protein
MKKLNNTRQVMGSRRSRLEKLAPLVDLKLGLRREEVDFMLGSPQLLNEMLAAKWVQPVINRHKLQLYDRGDIVRAWTRILNGEEPPRLARAKAGRRNKDGGENNFLRARAREGA